MKPTNSVYAGGPPLDEPDHPTCQICESQFTSGHELDMHMAREHKHDPEDLEP